MAQTNGYVLETDADGWARVVAERNRACGTCSSIDYCGITRTAASEKTKAINKANANPGDLVRISIGSAVLLRRMALLYLVPVVGLMAGAFLGSALAGFFNMSQTGSAVLLGMTGFAIGAFFALYLSKRLSEKRPLHPEITRILRPSARVKDTVVTVECAACTV